MRIPEQWRQRAAGRSFGRALTIATAVTALLLLVLFLVVALRGGTASGDPLSGAVPAPTANSATP